MAPGKFQVSRSGKLVSYSEARSENDQLEGVFVATMGLAADDDAITIKADKAARIIHLGYQQRYLLFSDGVRYQGRPGEANYRVTRFEGLARRIEQTELAPFTTKKINLLTTNELFAMDGVDAQAALQWRLSAPLLIMIIALLGITMSYTTPRRGRYIMLFPSILLYLVYLVLLNAARGAVEEQTLSPLLGLWFVHGLFLLLAFLLLSLRSGLFKAWLEKLRVKVVAA
jgi:lipopolysaccharide export system permease protein